MGPAEDEGEQERDPLRAAREVNLETRVAMGLVGATKSIVIHRDEYTYTGWESTLTNVSIGDVGKNDLGFPLAHSVKILLRSQIHSGLKPPGFPIKLQ